MHPYRGEEYPDLSEICGVISLGGPMGANDQEEHPWIKKECELLKASFHEGKPTVGICLGAQMMAKALGATVERNPVAEVGWFPVELNEEGCADPVLGAAGTSPTLYHWHADTFHLPRGAKLLARSHHCARQAYRMGEHAYGFQFHPEADHQLVLEWLSLEGIEDDINEWRKAHGSKTVQDLVTQRNHAFKGEKGSLKITAAIGSLFRDKEYKDPQTGFRDHLESLATARALVRLEFHGSDGRVARLRGAILSFLSIARGDFIIFQEETTLLWPVRIDDIIRVALA